MTAIEREELLSAAAQREVALAQKNAEVEEERRNLKELAEAHASLANHKNQIGRELKAVKLTTHTQATQNNKPPTELVPPPGILTEDGRPWRKKAEGKVERVGTAMGRGGGLFCGPSAKTD